MSRVPSGSQTVGPFFNFALTDDTSLGTLATPKAEGEHIRLRFQVVDGDGLPTPGDSMIELWQADGQGRYQHPLDPSVAHTDPEVRGFGRLETALDGTCEFQTVKPGPVPTDDKMQAPHINVAIFARGLLKQLYTRVYFEGEAANATDPVLALVAEDRRATLMAKPVPGEPGTWFFGIRLQGDQETVFFDV